MLNPFPQVYSFPLVQDPETGLREMDMYNKSDRQLPFAGIAYEARMFGAMGIIRTDPGPMKPTAAEAWDAFSWLLKTNQIKAYAGSHEDESNKALLADWAREATECDVSPAILPMTWEDFLALREKERWQDRVRRAREYELKYGEASKSFGRLTKPEDFID